MTPDTNFHRGMCLLKLSLRFSFWTCCRRSLAVYWVTSKVCCRSNHQGITYLSTHCSSHTVHRIIEFLHYRYSTVSGSSMYVSISLRPVHFGLSIHQSFSSLWVKACAFSRYWSGVVEGFTPSVSWNTSRTSCALQVNIFNSPSVSFHDVNYLVGRLVTADLSIFAESVYSFSVQRYATVMPTSAHKLVLRRRWS